MGAETYLDNIKFGAEHLINGIFSEREKLRCMHLELHRLEAIIERRVFDECFEVQKKGPRPENVGISASLELKAMLYPQRQQVADSIEEIKKIVEDRLFSAQCLSGALLQLAKQGISSIYGDPQKAPTGREVEGIALRDLIIAGRNQYMHAEEGNLRSKTVEIFEKLAGKWPESFSSYRCAIKSFEIIKILNWISWYDFDRDMESILGRSDRC